MAKSRSGRSKKRRFTGNRYTIRATINENDETSELNSTESASAKKLESSHTRLELIEDSVSGLCSHMNPKCKTAPFFKGFRLLDREDERFFFLLGLIKPSIVLGPRDNWKRISQPAKNYVLSLRSTFPVKTCFPQSRKQSSRESKLNHVAQENINAALSEIKGSQIVSLNVEYPLMVLMATQRLLIFEWVCKRHIS
ncbi:hypothetical protein TNCV_4344951 [Trichonephila clavipes]|nr:hypothetical protein TNCV_4344951 [Trichonephila clavipes]